MTTRRTFLASAAVATAAAAAPAAQAQNGGSRRFTSGRVRMKDSTELFVKDWGAGRPVILTHAWPLNSDCWDQQAVALVRAGYRVIAYDRRGFGRSSQPPGGYDYDTFADDLGQVIEATGARNITLIGYSMGGGEIVRYLSRHGSRGVIKIGLVGSVAPGIVKTKLNPQGVEPSFFDGLKENLLKDKVNFFAGLLKDVFYDVTAGGTFPVTKEVLDWSWHQAMQAGLQALIGSVDAFGGADFRPELSAVDVPTLVLHGTADKPVPLALTGRPAAAGIRQSKLIEYEGISHRLLVTERERVTRDILEFLKG